MKIYMALQAKTVQLQQAAEKLLADLLQLGLTRDSDGPGRTVENQRLGHLRLIPAA